MITCEEVFELDADARAEFELVCDEWNEEAIRAQEAEMSEEELCWWMDTFASCPTCFGKK